jgi:GWxTD domain-containing protein
MLILALLAITGPQQGPAVQSEQGLAIRAVRFYRADAKQTRVKAFVQVPYASMLPTADGPSGQLSYEVAVQVSDSTGLKLYQTGWKNHVPAAMREPGASAMDMVDFALAPGKYRLEVTVSDSVSGHKLSSAVDVDAFTDPPAASDLMLAPQMRLATGEDTVPRPGELRRGNTLITASAQLLLTPLRARAFYLLEAYAAQDAAGTMQVTVRDSSGRPLVQTKPTAVTLQGAAGGAILKGQLDLTGLPAGRYDLRVALTVAGATTERGASFTMAPLEATLAREQERRLAARTTDAGYFEALTERELDEAEAPLVYLATSGALKVYGTLSPGAKRQFLTQFWAQRDPTPATPKNEARERFYEAIAYATKQYTEGGRAPTPGWRSDRGRIYARHGAPIETLTRRNAGKAPPYEVWRYREGKDRWYIFVDRTNIGGYHLMATNDTQESGLPGWQDLLGQDAVQDVGRFLGIDFTDNSTSRRF